MKKIVGSQAVPMRYRIVGLLVAIAVVAAAGGATSLTARAVLPALPNTVQQWNKIAEDTVVGSGAFQGEGEVYMSLHRDSCLRRGRRHRGRLRAVRSWSQRPCGCLRRLRCGRGRVPHAAPLLPVQCGFGYEPQRLLLRRTLEPERMHSRWRRGNECRIGCREQHRRPSYGRWAHDPDWYSVAVRDEEPRPRSVASHSAFAAPQTPWLGSVQPFLLKSPGQFRTEPPPPLTSQQWVQGFNEVKAYGEAGNNTPRTTEQTAVARFWTANVIRQFNIAARDLATGHSLNLLETARLFAMVNTVSADALMSVLNSKYRFLFWRPVTAINPTAVTADSFGPVPGFDDGNPRTIEIPVGNHWSRRPTIPGTRGLTARTRPPWPRSSANSWAPTTSISTSAASAPPAYPGTSTPFVTSTPRIN